MDRILRTERLHARVPAEPLEKRIAPAIIFFTGTDAVTSEGVSVNDQASALAAGAGLAVLLGKGDSLIIDLDGDGKYSARKDALIASVTTGRSRLYFTDLDASLTFSKDELTGMFVSHGFLGNVAGDIHGSVVTGLSATGAPAFVETRSDLAGLQVSGRITGAVLADGSVKNLNVRSAGTNDEPSVGSIRTGDAADGAKYSFNGGSNEFTFASSAALVAPDISIISLAFGAQEIVAGGGSSGGGISKVVIGRQITDLTVQAGSANALSGGSGGAITGITINGASEDVNFLFTAGHGSSSAAKSGNGGAISGVTIHAGGVNLGSVSFLAGAGGDASSSGDEFFASSANGGAGGSVHAITVRAASADDITVKGGNGGEAGYIYQDPVYKTVTKKVKMRDEYGAVYYDYIEVEQLVRRAVERGGAGGAGGSVSAVTLDLLAGAAVFQGGDGGAAQLKNGGNAGGVNKVTLQGAASLEVSGGEGGEGYSAQGGHGGAISGFTALKLAEGAEVSLQSGMGGFGWKRVGAAGGISKVLLKSAEVVGNISIIAAEGTAGGEEDTGNSATAGGAGGSISAVTVEVKSAESLTVRAGAGGAGGEMEMYTGDPDDGASSTIVGGAGGAGGSISKLTFKALETAANATVTAGAGGAGQVNKAGGAGGRITGVILSGIANLDMKAGNGGGVEVFGNGGAGGAISGVSITGGGADSVISLAGGNASAGAGGGSGGAGGGVTKVTKSQIAGGDVRIVGGTGGDGSALYIPAEFKEVEKKVKRRDEYGDIYYDYVTVQVKVRNAVSKAGSGGAGGRVSGVALKALAGSDADVTINGGGGGRGKSITVEVEKKIKRRDEYGDVYYDYVTVSVAKASKPAAAGGSISGIALEALANSTLSFNFTGGQGGHGDEAAKAAAGGKISGVTVRASGNVGDFTLQGGHGGASEFRAGAAGGSISKVLVSVVQNITGVATIIAGSGGAGEERDGGGGSLTGISVTAANEFSTEFAAGDGSPPGKLSKVNPLIL